MSGKVNLERWSPHLEAARHEGKSLSAYARGRGLSRHTLYAARQMLAGVQGEPGVRRRGQGARRTKPLARSAFAAVELLAPSSPPALNALTPRLQARLPNGVTLELACAGTHEPLLVAAIRALSGR